MPVLQLLLARDGGMHVVQHLEVDEARDAVLRSEASKCPGAMLVQPCSEVRGDPGVKSAVPAAGEDVDAGLPRHDFAFRSAQIMEGMADFARKRKSADG